MAVIGLNLGVCIYQKDRTYRLLSYIHFQVFLLANSIMNLTVLSSMAKKF